MRAASACVIWRTLLPGLAVEQAPVLEQARTRKLALKVSLGPALMKLVVVAGLAPWKLSWSWAVVIAVVAAVADLVSAVVIVSRWEGVHAAWVGLAMPSETVLVCCQ